MWDEKQFFSDFARSSDSIKADSAFKEHLKVLPQMKEKKKKIRIERYVLAVACTLCVVLGAAGINRLIRNNDLKTPDANAGVVSGTETGLISGNNIIISDTYDRAVEYLADDSIVVTDADGKELTHAQKETLLKKITRSTLITKETKKKYTSYFCMGDKQMEIRVYEGSEDEISLFES